MSCLIFFEKQSKEIISDFDFLCQWGVVDGELGEVPWYEGPSGQLAILQESLNLGLERVE